MQVKLPRLAVGLLALLAAAATASALVGVASGDTKGGPPTFRGNFTTVFKAPLSIEGLTAGRDGNLYSAGRAADPCPVWRVSPSGGPATVVGNVPAPCSPTGIAFDRAGRLYVADDDQVLVFTPNAASPPTATVFASGLPGANGIAFDRDGNLWVSDGGTAQGRVWRVGSDGVPTEMFRVQPLTNDVNLVSGVGGVGRDNRSLPPGTVTITPTGRQAANTLGSQHLVANGLAFTENGRTLFVADTARGAIWQVELDRRGRVTSPVGCDTTFTANTLCLDNVFVQHPFLDGADGIALDRDDNIWVAANERNAMVVVTPRGRVVEFFRNAPAAARLRNEGPLEFPTSPFIVDRTLCVTQSDGSRRDNFPNTGGEVGPAPAAERAKIACLDRPLDAAGLPLPIR